MEILSYLSIHSLTSYSNLDAFSQRRFKLLTRLRMDACWGFLAYKAYYTNEPLARSWWGNLCYYIILLEVNLSFDHEAQMETHRCGAQDIGNESASHLPEGKRTKKRRKDSPERIYHVIRFRSGFRLNKYKWKSDLRRSFIQSLEKKKAF